MLLDTSVGWVVRECRNEHEIANLTCEEHTRLFFDNENTNARRDAELSLVSY